MKRFILLIVVAGFTFTGELMAQKGKELIIGVNGALTNVWIMNQNFYGEPEVEYAPKMGYAASFNLGYNIDESMSIIAELQYSVQGQKYEDKQTINNIKYDAERDIDLRYVNIPLFFKYAFGQGLTKFRFLAGPQLGLLLDATQEYTRDGKTLNTVAEDLEGNTFFTDAEEIKDRFESTDVAIVLDLGADIHISKQFYIGAGGRINYGLTDINAENYRIKDLDGEYTPSHNFWGGLYIGINYKIDVEGYSQRSF
jgi:hypothetical protein